MKPYSIRIFLPDGIPDGLRIIEKSNWTGKGVVCPRALLNTAKSRKEFSRAGVYILTGPADSGELPKVYIGEAETIGNRLSQHAIKKDFWTSVAFFVSKDDNLNKAHVQYLESLLVSLATQAKRCKLDNATEPNLPSLSEADQADVEAFFDEMLLCLPAIGINVFEKPPQKRDDVTLLFCQGAGVLARGYESTDGFVVMKGSEGRGVVTKGCKEGVRNIRSTLLNSGVLSMEGKKCLLTQDYTFSAPSYAAAIFLGRAANGRTEWKTEDGRTLKQLQEAENTE
jgi:hypothetical protein